MSDFGLGADALRQSRAYHDVLALDGPGEQAWCVERTGRNQWSVYWAERGHPAGEEMYADSAEAAGHVLVGRLIYSRLVAGGGWWGASE